MVNLNKYLTLAISLFLILVNVFLQHYYAPVGILLSIPICIVAIGLLNINKQSFNIIFKSFLCFLLIGINDVGIKLYSGGIHDSEGQGVVNLVLFVCLGIGFLMLLISNFNKAVIARYIVSLTIFVLLAAMHLSFFGGLGLGRSYPILYNITT